MGGGVRKRDREREKNNIYYSAPDTYCISNSLTLHRNKIVFTHWFLFARYYLQHHVLSSAALLEHHHSMFLLIELETEDTHFHIYR